MGQDRLCVSPRSPWRPAGEKKGSREDPPVAAQTADATARPRRGSCDREENRALGPVMAQGERNGQGPWFPAVGVNGGHCA